MNPAPYMQLMNPNAYTQGMGQAGKLMDPQSYTKWFEDMTKAMDPKNYENWYNQMMGAATGAAAPSAPQK
jgi:hypothetical protein